MTALDHQFYAFFVFILAGVAAGLLYDVLRVLRRHLQPGGVLGTAADLAYWALTTAVFAVALLTGSHGELRFYVLLALALGAGLYFYLASPAALWGLAVLAAALASAWRVGALLVGIVVVRPVLLLAAVIRGLLTPLGLAGRAVLAPVLALALWPRRLALGLWRLLLPPPGGGAGSDQEGDNPG